MCTVTIPGFKCKGCGEKRLLNDDAKTDECQDKKDGKECTTTRKEKYTENKCQDCVQDDPNVGYTFGSTPY
ncbi:hypothetical protein NW768_011883 [Fusarium equiseti]|uniref:Uncharacterized protein n=1 Tax=Fusarium equiseti TaxID=61235 RepID=A0ABQ8QW81_FUSEQ|nr:hypothetical protein NW768_011883 [Fusarium equiseti]